MPKRVGISRFVLFQPLWGRLYPNMNHRTDEDENRGHESWLSSLARVYGPWHLGITAIQGAAWTAFVYWNESGKHERWADVVQIVGEKTWVALTAFFITSAIILAVIQKGGRMVLTFMDERRKRIEKAQAEARAEGRAEGRDEGRAEGRVEGHAEGRAEGRMEGREEGRAEERARSFAEWSEWNRRREEAARRGERFDEPPPSLNGR